MHASLNALFETVVWSDVLTGYAIAAAIYYFSSIAVLRESGCCVCSPYVAFPRLVLILHNVALCLIAAWRQQEDFRSFHQ